MPVDMRLALNQELDPAPAHVEHEVSRLRRKIPEGDLECSVYTSQERGVRAGDGTVTRSRGL